MHPQPHQPIFHVSKIEMNYTFVFQHYSALTLHSQLHSRNIGKHQQMIAAHACTPDADRVFLPSLSQIQQLKAATALANASRCLNGCRPGRASSDRLTSEVESNYRIYSSTRSVQLRRGCTVRRRTSDGTGETDAH